jgi:thymidine kinase
MFSPEDDLFDLISDENGGRISYNSYLEWIFVDEAQFLTEEQVDQLSDVVDYLGINVMCYGLRTDFKSKLFPGSKRLFELADTIEEIKSTCECGNKTIINARVDKDGNVLKNGPQTLVGGDDRYISICRKCWKRSI